jgi:hypothetical protein
MPGAFAFRRHPERSPALFFSSRGVCAAPDAVEGPLFDFRRASRSCSANTYLGLNGLWCIKAAYPRGQNENPAYREGGNANGFHD